MDLPTPPKQTKMDDDGGNNYEGTSKPVFYMESSDFFEIIQNATFVDKSMLIKEVIIHNRALITVPRRFGKTSNISMLKYFFEIQVDENGKPQTKANYLEEPVKDTSSYKLFVKNELKITKDTKIMDQHFGRYPVIHADFKCDRDIYSFDDAVAFGRYVVHKCFKEHAYLLKSEKLNDDQKSTCEMWCDDISYKNLDNHSYVTRGLTVLSKYLYEHFNRKCVVLIDEYDSLVSKAMFTVTDKKLLHRIIKCNLGIMSAVLYNRDQSVYLGMLTGISFISSYDLRVGVYRFLEEHRFLDFYGFTENEVNNLFDNPDFELDSKLKERARSTYDGYVSRYGRKIYSLWSILNFLHEKKVKNYWKSSGILCNFENVFKVDAIRETIETLLHGESVIIEMSNPDTTGTAMVNLRNLITKSLWCRYSRDDLFFMFLLEQGYLTHSQEKSEDRKCRSVKIPNEEIKQVFYQHLIDYYHEFITSFDEKLDNISPAVTAEFEKDLDKFCKLLESLCGAFSGISLTEAGLQCFMLSIICKTKHNYITEHCVGHGRMNLLMLKEKYGIIIELKYKRTARAALQQIIDRKYYRVFKDRDVDNCILVGINMGEDLKVSMSYLTRNPNIDGDDDIDIDEAKHIPL